MEEEIKPQLPAESPQPELPAPSFGEKLKANKGKILGGVLGILVFAGAVFGAYKLSQRQVKPGSGITPTPEAVATPAPDPTADWKTYTNTEYGYSIKYPSDYVVAPVGAGVGQLAEQNSIVAFLEERGDYSFFELPVLYIEVYSKRFISEGFKEPTGSGDLLNLGNYAQKSYEMKGDETLTPLETLQLSGKDAFSFDFIGPKRTVIGEISWEDNNEHKIIFAKHNDNIFEVAYSKTNPYDLILSTFKFLEKGEEWRTYSNTNAPFTFKYPLELSYFVQNTAEATGLKNIIIQIQNWDPDKPFPSDFNTNRSYFNFLISGHIGEDFQAMLNDSDLGLDETERERIEVGEIEAFEGMGKRHGEEGVKTVMFQYKDWVFTAQGWPKHSNKLEWFDQILSTFRFLD